MALFTFINAAGAIVGLLVAAPIAAAVGLWKLFEWLAFNKWWNDR